MNRREVLRNGAVTLAATGLWPGTATADPTEVLVVRLWDHESNRDRSERNAFRRAVATAIDQVRTYLHEQVLTRETRFGTDVEVRFYAHTGILWSPRRGSSLDADGLFPTWAQRRWCINVVLVADPSWRLGLARGDPADATGGRASVNLTIPDVGGTAPRKYWQPITRHELAHLMGAGHHHARQDRRGSSSVAVTDMGAGYTMTGTSFAHSDAETPDSDCRGADWQTALNPTFVNAYSRCTDAAIRRYWYGDDDGARAYEFGPPAGGTDGE
jgi:hypothetical protein